ncbi:MAG: 1-acyl-sn-glycerol-3-phosphate acyltransferase [Planctomycetota bacterium]
MQNVFIEKPYQFVPPSASHWLQKLLLRTPLLRRFLRRREGVVSHEIHGLQHLRTSIDAGHGILLPPNHPRMADPLVMYHVAAAVKTPFFTMASWHLFNQGWWKRQILRVMGGFSVNRESVDRQSVDAAVDILTSATGPLLVFAEGTTSRTNDQLMAFMDGPAFIARTAAKRRAKQNGGAVVAHPVAIKYVFRGDIEQTCDEIFSDIEQRLTWQPQRDIPLLQRLQQLGDALLTLKELEHGVATDRSLPLRQRQTHMVNHLLHPLENEWLGGPRSEDGIAIRIKNLRMKIFPDMSNHRVDADESKRRWKQLADTYLAQQIDCYPEKYVDEFPSVDRILETAEKFDEDVNSYARIVGNLHAIIQIGPAIQVAGKRQRDAQGEPLTAEISSQIQTMLDGMKDRSTMYEPTTTP